MKLIDVEIEVIYDIGEAWSTIKLITKFKDLVEILFQMKREKASYVYKTNSDIEHQIN